MSRKIAYLVPLLLALILALPLITSAQDTEPPAALLNAALADLSSRAGTTVTLDDLTRWSWTLDDYPDASLGCPQEGQTYAQVVTTGYRFEFVYSGATFDYRANENGSTLFLCSGPASIAPQPTAAPTSTPVPAQPDEPAAPAPTDTLEGRAVCENAMNTRLNVGDEARVREAGLAVNLRAEATAASARVDQMQPGETFAIVGGPTCAENLVWWNVRYGEQAGWAGEGANGVYWIEPTGNRVAQATPVPAATAGAAAAPAAAGFTEQVTVYAVPGGFRTPITAENALDLARQVELPIGEPVTGVAWAPDRVLLAVTTQSGVRLYNILTIQNAPRELVVPDGPTYGAVFNTDGSLLATAHQDTIVRVWDINTGGLRALLRGHTQPVFAVAFDPGGNLLASGGGNPGSGEDSNIRLWDVNARAETNMLAGHTGAVTALAFSPDGSLLASAGLDGTVRFWDVASASPGTVLTNHNGPVRDIAFSPDGTILASVGDDGIARLYAIESGEQRELPGETPLAAVAFTPDGSLLITGATPAAGVEESAFVRLWDVDAGTLIGTLPTFDVAPDATLADLTLDDDAITLAEALTQEERGTVRLWTLLE